MSLRGVSSSKPARRLSHIFGLNKPSPPQAESPTITESPTTASKISTPTTAPSTPVPSSPSDASFSDGSLTATFLPTLELDLGPDFLTSAVIEHIEQEQERKARENMLRRKR